MGTPLLQSALHADVLRSRDPGIFSESLVIDLTGSKVQGKFGRGLGGIVDHNLALHLAVNTFKKTIEQLSLRVIQNDDGRN